MNLEIDINFILGNFYFGKYVLFIDLWILLLVVYYNYNVFGDLYNSLVEVLLNDVSVGVFGGVIINFGVVCICVIMIFIFGILI